MAHADPVARAVAVDGTGCHGGRMTTATIPTPVHHAQEGVHTLLLVVRDATAAALQDDPDMTATDVLSLMDITMSAARLGAQHAACRYCSRPITRRTTDSPWFHGEEPLAFEGTFVTCHDAAALDESTVDEPLDADWVATPEPGTIRS
jgi:hypothetical protein